MIPIKDKTIIAFFDQQPKDDHCLIDFYTGAYSYGLMNKGQIRMERAQWEVLRSVLESSKPESLDILTDRQLIWYLQWQFYYTENALDAYIEQYPDTYRQIVDDHIGRFVADTEDVASQGELVKLCNEKGAACLQLGWKYDEVTAARCAAFAVWRYQHLLAGPVPDGEERTPKKREV